MAFTAVRSTIPAAAYLLFFSNIFWTIAYDTQYAMADREDDLKIGIKSTAILFGKQDLLIIAILQILALILLALAGSYFQRGWIYGAGLIIAAAYFISQHLLARTRQPEDCIKAFINNHRVGMAIFIGLALDFNVQN